MKTFTKKITILFTALFLSASLFADSYHVCLGSYKVRQNAEALLSALTKQDLSAAIVPVTLKDETYYRVVLIEAADNIEDARIKVTVAEHNDAIKKLGITGIWPCSVSVELEPEPVKAPVVPIIPQAPAKSVVQVKEPEPEFIPEPEIFEAAPEEKQVVVLKSNKTGIPLSDERPYSVLVRTYREEQSAIHDKNRLIEEKMNAYILKEFDDKTFFDFTLHAGAFETEAEAEELKAQFDSMGIMDTQISNYADIKAKLEKYDQIIAEDDVIYEVAEASIPEHFSADAAKTILQFPVNKDFMIENITIFDIEKMHSVGDEIPSNNLLQIYLYDEDQITAASFTQYKDNLYNKNVRIAIQTGEKNLFDEELIDLITDDEDPTTYIELAAAGGRFDCYYYQDGANFELEGFSKDRSVMINLTALDFTEAQFKKYLDNISSDSNLLIYPQLRKTLAVLPKNNAEIPLTFRYFNLARVKPNYVTGKKNADWAYPRVGHWDASSMFDYNGDTIYIEFFDMEYDYISNRVQQMFDKAHETTGESDTNHYEALSKANGWYVNPSYQGGEISFSYKSFNICIGSQDELDMTTETELKQMCEDLKVW